MKKTLNKILQKFNLVLIDKYELQAYNTTVENKFLLEKKIELWYKMYKGENFAKFFNIKTEKVVNLEKGMYEMIDSVNSELNSK